jgi:hypothetical protein
MNIEFLSMFCYLADSKSFTKTAQINGVTQSLALVEISDSRFFRPTAAICKMRRVLSPALKIIS